VSLDRPEQTGESINISSTPLHYAFELGPDGFDEERRLLLTKLKGRKEGGHLVGEVTFDKTAEGCAARIAAAHESGHSAVLGLPRNQRSAVIFYHIGLVLKSGRPGIRNTGSKR
jgi:hypothetical protein